MAIPQSAAHIANQAGDFVPQHQNNFLIEIAGLEGDDRDLIVLSLMTLALPTERNGVVSLPYGNETRKVAGRAEFEDVPLKVRDYVDRQVRAALVRWRKLVYDSDTGFVGLPSQYKKSANIIMQATNGTHLRAVKLFGVWPSALTPGSLDMSSDAPVEIDMTLTYDKAKWNL